MSGSSIFASVWLSGGVLCEVEEGRPRYVGKVAGSDDLTDGRQATRDGDIWFVAILSSGALDFSQCILNSGLVGGGGGYILYLVARSPGWGPCDALGAGNSAVSGGAADNSWLLPVRTWIW